MAAESIVSDGDIDLSDEYRDRVYADWAARPLEPVAGLTEGRLHEPPGIGLPLLLAPAYALGGTTAAQLVVAALLALGGVATAGLARRLVPDPWATAATVVAFLSPPVLAWSTTVTPDPVAAAALAGAALFTLRVRDDPRPARAAVAAVLIGVLPWLSVAFLPVTAVCAAALARWLRRRSRGMTAFVALEIVLVSAVALLTASERLYGGLSPYAAVPGPATGADTPAEYLERIPRLVTALFGTDAGLVTWAPFGALAFVALALLARSVRERLALALPEVVHVEVTAGFLAALCATQLAVAAFLAPSLDGAWFPGRHLLPAVPAGAALCAWGLRHAPRAGAALAALTVGGGIWLVVAGHLDGAAQLAPPGGVVPWAGAEAAACAVAAAATAILLARELRRDRALAAA
jgi:hypothetical protein